MRQERRGFKAAAVLTALLGAWTLAGAPNARAQESGALAEPEQQAMSDTLQHALEYNQTDQASQWVNPDTGRAGGVTPVRTFENAQGQPCREFTETIIIGGNEEQGYGTACRQPDGSWEIVPEAEEAPAPPSPPAQRTYVSPPPPPAYYAYPDDVFGPYHIYLSFSTVFRGGHLHRGRYYLAGDAFRHRHPLVIHRRIFVGPGTHRRHRWWRNRREHRDDRRGWGHEGRGHDHRGRGDEWERDDRDDGRHWSRDERERGHDFEGDRGHGR